MNKYICVISLFLSLSLSLSLSLIHTHIQDQEEEEDTESGDREGELRAERIARLQVKLEHYKKLLQEEENTLQEVENEYVVGMEVSVNDKDQQK